MTMKIRVPTIAAVVQFLCFVLTWSSFQAAATDAVIADDKGTKTSVTGIRAHLQEICKPLLYYSDVATETDTEWNSIFLLVHDNSYRVEIPLDIIKTATRGQSDAKDKLSRRSEQWTVVLSDDTRLVGNPTTFEDFKARADLGDFSIPWRSVSQITFSSPKTTHQAKANGSRAVTLYVTDSEKRSLTGATFIYEEWNKNGCFVGFSYKSSLPFVTDGGAKYDITWNKVRELRFDVVATRALGLCNGLPTGVVHLVSQSGAEYRGSFGSFEDPAHLCQSGSVRPLGIEAVGRIGAFDLHMIIPFVSTAKSLTVDER